MEDVKVTSKPVTIAAVTPEDFPTTFTYLDPDDTKKSVTTHGVQFLPGEATDLSEFLQGDALKQAAQKLANNRFFLAEGGENLIEQQAKREEARAQLAAEAAENDQKAREEDEVEEAQLENPIRGPRRGRPPTKTE